MTCSFLQILNLCNVMRPSKCLNSDSPCTAVRKCAEKTTKTNYFKAMQSGICSRTTKTSSDSCSVKQKKATLSSDYSRHCCHHAFISRQSFHYHRITTCNLVIKVEVNGTTPCYLAIGDKIMCFRVIIRLASP